MQPIRFSILIIALFVAIPRQSHATAQSYSNQSAEALFNEGIGLFQQHQYTAAQKSFETYLTNHNKKYRKEAASYYLILSALENKDPRVETLIQHFIISYPNNPQIATIYHHLAKRFFTKGMFDKSLAIYKKIRPEQLTPEDRIALQYDLADTYLKLKNWSNAKEHFSNIKDKSTPYYYPAQLKIAYIAFEQEDYGRALNALQESSQNPHSLPEARSLTLKVYHKAAQFESLLTYANNFSTPSFSSNDRIFIADAHFFLKQYQEAIVHYQAYLGNSTIARRETIAKIGYAFYATQQYPQALAYFKQLHHKEDYPGQISAYYSGLIYEQNGALEEAIMAFSTAESQSFDPAIRNLASIKRAGIRYQQGLITEAVDDITTFIRDNQDSQSLSIAQTLLVQCHYKTKAYKQAIDYIAALPYKNEKILKLYQKALFYQGLEAYNNGKPDEAITHFKQSLLFPFKVSLISQTQFWLAEALSSLEKYDKALKLYVALQQQSTLSSLYHTKTLYGLAYAYFNTGNYTAAAQHFKDYVSATQQQPSAAHYDAILRLGDCFYVKKNYNKALEAYESTYQYNPAHVRYQEALIYELLGDNLRAAQCLQEVIGTHAKTQYYEKALYHEACRVFNAGNYDTAIQKFSYLIQIKPTSSLQPELLMKRALAYENLKKYDEASLDYIAILEQHPPHVNTENALIALSNLFAAQGTPEKIEIYLEKHARTAQHAAIDSDKRMVEAARKLFYTQEYDKVLKQLGSFHITYPDSKLLSETYFLMAESYYRLQKNSQAIHHYKKVVASGLSSFHVKAQLRLADIAYATNRLQEAMVNYQKLQKVQLNNKEYDRTLMGLIRSSFKLKKHQITTATCLQLLNNPKGASVETLQEAHLYLGKIALQREAYKNARSHFLKANAPLHTATAAEAQYLLATTAFKLKAYQSSLDNLFDLVEKFPYNKNYIDHAFLLMADNYIILGNLTQAKATLDSIIGQSKNKKNVEIAKKKRAGVLARLKK